MTHRALLSAVWGENSVEQPAYLRVFIGHLRKKLEPDEGNPRYIMTIPGLDTASNRANDSAVWSHPCHWRVHCTTPSLMHSSPPGVYGFFTIFLFELYGR